MSHEASRTLDAARSWTAEPVSTVIYITLQ